MAVGLFRHPQGVLRQLQNGQHLEGEQEKRGIFGTIFDQWRKGGILTIRPLDT